MKLFSKIALVFLCLLSVACKKHIDYSIEDFTTFVNQSQHKVSVSLDVYYPKCDISCFMLLPGEKFLLITERQPIQIEKATVTYDDTIQIVHERTDANNPVFRNICFLNSSWWEKKYESPHDDAGWQSYYTFTFTDEDYDYAVKVQ